MRCVFPERVVKCTLVVVLKGWLEIRVGTIFNDDLCSLSWRETTKISQALLGNQHLNIVFRMIDMGDHWNNAGNLTVLCLGWSHEYGDIGIPCKIT